jgi:predicted transglutaminase-like cysteine proteinase
MFAPRSRTIGAISGAFMTAVLGTACSHARETAPAPAQKDAIAFIIDATEQTQTRPAALPQAEPGSFLQFGDVTQPPIGYMAWCLRDENACVGDVFSSAASIVTLTPDRWRELNEVNNYWNAVLKPQTDQVTYGVQEYWTVPAPGDFADCEDYVLAKRKDLMARGWPREALLITVVRDRDNQVHAVLTVRTDLADMSLDNMETAILPWSRSPHRFVKIQNPDQPSEFIALKPLNPAAQTVRVDLRGTIK